MTALVDRLRLWLDLTHLRQVLNRRRRLVAALLAGFGIFFLATAMRSPEPSTSFVSQADSSLATDEVAVPVVISPAGAVNALAPGTIVDLIRAGTSTPVVEGARVIDIPTSGFGPSSEAIAIIALEESAALSLASHPAEPVGVMIRGHT
jgi:hypothetical protein